MSKRAAGWQGGEERYGAYAGQAQEEDMAPKAQHATAAQLAKRKILSVKGARRPRSESPLTNTGSIFEQANSSGLIGNNSNSTNTNAFNNNNNTGFSFGQTSTNGTTSTSFGSGGGSFAFGGNIQPTQNSNSSFTFGTMNNASTPSNSFTFGSNQPQESQTNGASANTGYKFGSPFQQNSDANQKPASTAFQFGTNQDQSVKPQSNIFGAAQNDQTKSPSIFGGFGNNQPAQSASTPFQFGGSTPDAGQAKPASTPQLNIFGQTQKETATTPAQPVSNGWTSFLNQTKPAENNSAIANGTSSNSIFSTPAQTNGQTKTPTQSIFSNGASQAPTPSFGFTTAPAVDNDASMMSPDNTPQKPVSRPFETSTINGTPSQDADATKPLFGAKKSLFDRVTRDPTTDSASQTPAPSSNIFSGFKPTQPTPLSTTKAQDTPSTTTAKPPSPEQSITTSQSSTFVATPSQASQPKSVSMDSTKPEHFQDIRELNEALLQHLQSQDRNKDWSSIFEYYKSQITTIVTKPAAPNLGNSILGKSAFAQPAAAPVSQPTKSSSLFSSTQKPVEIQYPKLADTASKTAKLFEATLDKPASEAPKTFGTSLFSTQPSAAATSSSGIFKPSTTSLFAPKTNGDASSAVAEKPATTGFVPSGVPAVPKTNNFLSSFGQQAKAAEEEARKRRRDNDYDSDEEDEAAWEKRDAEEQAQKRAKLAEDAKSASNFSFTKKPDSASTNNFALANSGSNGSAKNDSEQTSQGEDHTWKQGTPIKFAGAQPSSTATPAPVSTGLFGASSTPAPLGGSIFASTTPAGPGKSNIFASATKPAFNFGQPSTSTSAAPAQETQEIGNDDEEAPAEPQQEDLAVLLPAEQEENDVLFHVEKAKSRKLDGESWKEKGLGPLWILRDKSSGKARVLQKTMDSGRVVMNFGVLKGPESLYKHSAGTKTVQATFVDHLGDTGSKPTSWTIVVGKSDNASEIHRVLQEARGQA